MSASSQFNNIIPPYSMDCVCIICGGSFTVSPKNPFHGDRAANQTLFCQSCLNTLKDALKREETKDFGW